MSTTAQASSGTQATSTSTLQKCVSNPPRSPAPAPLRVAGQSKLARIRRELVQCGQLAFARNLKLYLPLQKEKGDNLHAERIGLSCLLNPPTGSPYSGKDYHVTLVVTPQYPEEPPIVRFSCVIDHSQISALGHPTHLLRAWFEKKSISTLAEGLTSLRKMLMEPLEEDMPEQSDHEIFHEYIHRSTGRCIHKEQGLFDASKAERLADNLRKTWPIQVKKRFMAAAARQREAIDTQLRYKALHSQFFKEFDGIGGSGGLPAEWFDTRFLKALSSRTKKAFLAHMKEHTPGIYTFPMMTEAFCKMLEEEVHSFQRSGFPSSAPNSMNKYGVLLNLIGMENLWDAFLHFALRPLSAVLFSAEGGASLDHHHTFVVQYRPDADRSLDMHSDDADVTLNVCLSEGFQGGELDFCGRSGDKSLRKFGCRVRHNRGYAVLHLGRQRHGARDVTAGERNNLIIWGRSSKYRQGDMFHKRQIARHTSNPRGVDFLCLSRQHDADYEQLLGETEQKNQPMNQASDSDSDESPWWAN